MGDFGLWLSVLGRMSFLSRLSCFRLVRLWAGCRYKGGFLGMLVLCLRRLSICSMSWGVRTSILIAFRLPAPMARLRLRVFRLPFFVVRAQDRAVYVAAACSLPRAHGGRWTRRERRGLCPWRFSSCRGGTSRECAPCGGGGRAYTITPFDLLTAAALVVFAEAAVDVAVLEVGMGGRWDATSATDPLAVAITGIGLDHTRILGDTLEAIAGEKAAVIKPGRLVVLGEGTHEASVQRVMDARCREVRHSAAGGEPCHDQGAGARGRYRGV